MELDDKPLYSVKNPNEDSGTDPVQTKHTSLPEHPHPPHAHHSPFFHADTLDLPWQKVKVKVKLKVTLEKPTKAQSGSRSIALLFL